MKACSRVFLILLVSFLIPATDAPAVTLVTQFIGGTPPANAAGGGNLMDVVDAAARMWEAVYPDPATITLYIGWAPVGDAGNHTLVQQGGSPDREIAGRILFDNSGSVSFYLDPTPTVNDEYRRRTEEYQDLGGGFVNVARVYGDPSGDAAGRIDLLSVALHEIGHALGMCVGNEAFLRAARGGFIVITGELPVAGTIIPLASNNSGVTSHFDAARLPYGSLMTGICGNERRLPSALDIIANAQISGFAVSSLPGETVNRSSIVPRTRPN
jgi:hypothetical protein